MNRVTVTIKTKDTTPFYVKIDDVRVTGKRSLTYPSVGWHFDKVDDRIIVPHDPSLNLTDEISIIAWINPRTLGEGDYGRIVDKKATEAFAFLLYTGNKLYFENNSSSAISSADVINFNEWSLVGVNYHGTDREGKFYVNAQDVGDIGDLGALGTTTRDLYIGNILGLTRTFDGYIALLAIAKKSWSQQQHENFGRDSKSLFSPRAF